ncbi:39S ribosomal protein L9, mitochondrial [Merluccius polli]|uniref:Large ribosomal subunit protein bL9m n=1 Tax=Merluccius polli TaxID=89951 RepID=A0AA47MS41_MERPO|nr:39S ribosomal protein L9, mitochondrial [Merluccius polli]
MWGSSRRVLQEAVTSHVKCFSQTTCKNTVVVERWWQVPLAKEGRAPRLHPRRHRVFKLVEDTKLVPKEKNMELILTQTVEKLGGRGDTVFVKKSVGRNKLLAQGLAIYSSPENKQMFAEEIRTVDLLKRSHLKINKWRSDEYTLTQEIACRQFARKLGVIVPLHALRLPDEPIKDVGEYWCEVTVNGIDTVRIPVLVLPYEDQSVMHQKMLKKLRQENAASITAEGSSETAAHVLEASEVLTTPDGGSTASQEPLPSEEKTGPPTENHPKD